VGHCESPDATTKGCRNIRPAKKNNSEILGLRGRLKFDKEENAYFVTTTVMHFDRIFSLGDIYNDILINSLKYLICEQEIKLHAYVIMPSHIHLIVQFPKGESLIDFMRDFKKFTSTKIRQQLEKDRHNEIIEKLKANSVGFKKQIFKFWMERYDDLVLTSRRIFTTKLNYIHYNPVKAGLVNEPTDWKYSSARYYYLEDKSVIDLKIE
jgi:REP element-mobilizing transposase RayT